MTTSTSGSMNGVYLGAQIAEIASYYDAFRQVEGEPESVYVNAAALVYVRGSLFDGAFQYWGDLSLTGELGTVEPFEQGYYDDYDPLIPWWFQPCGARAAGQVEVSILGSTPTAIPVVGFYAVADNDPPSGFAGGEWNIEISGSLNLIADSYWPFKNSAGDAVFEENTGTQINPIS